MKLQSITKVIIITLGFIGYFSTNVLAQAPDVEDLPEYVIITTKRTGLIGGIGLSIDYKKSPYRDKLILLEDFLILKNQSRVRTQTDLLNVMYVLGFEYVNAFNSSAGSLGADTGLGRDTRISGSEETFRVSIVFKKTH